MKHAFVVGTIMVMAAGCVSEEQAARRDANTARAAASKDVLLQACYPVSDKEVENAKSLILNQGGRDSVYWYWRASSNTPTLVIVNAMSNVDLTPSCMNRIATACSNFGLEPSTGYVSRRQAADGQGEIKIKCSPRLEQT